MSPPAWQYKAFSPPAPATGLSFGEDMAAWLNRMQAEGWEFVGYMQRLWRDADTQQCWMFRRPRNG